MLKHHASKLYGTMEVKLQAILISALGQWLASRSGSLISVREPPISFRDETG